MPKQVRIIGRRGRWTAEGEGRQLPVIHRTWLRMPNCNDPLIGESRHTAKYAELMESFRRETRVVLQKDKPGSFERDGYIGVFEFTDFSPAEDGSFSLILTSRHADPKP